MLVAKWGKLMAALSDHLKFAPLAVPMVQNKVVGKVCMKAEMKAEMKD